MFCSACGQQFQAGESRCPKCGWTPATPATPPVVPVPSFEIELARYAGKVRVLGILWLVYAGLSLVLGFATMNFLHNLFSGGFPFMGHDHPNLPDWFAPALIHFAWIMLSVRAIICAIAGWGLLERAQWGRIMAIIAAVVCTLKFPLGTALGVATLIILLGCRNSALYDNL